MKNMKKLVELLRVVLAPGLFEKNKKQNVNLEEVNGEEQVQQESELNEENTNAEAKNQQEETEKSTMAASDNDIVMRTSGNFYGRLKVTGSKLTDSSGNPVQLKGISTHGIAWYPDYVNNDCFRDLHDNFEVNVIRIAMYTAEYNGYCSGGNKGYLKDLVNKGVQYATNNNMYAIIDWHILSDSNPNMYLSEAKQFFTEMASKYASNDHVIYEICNEPNGGTSWSDIKNYATEVIKVIRKYDRNGIIIVGTPNWSQYVDQAAKNPIKGYNNIMYALHFYAATHTDSLRNKMVSALNAGLPIFVSEFGICDASGNGSIDERQAGQWISLMNSRNVSYVMWNLSNKQETSAIINSWCTKKSGFTVNDLSASGKWFLKMMTGQLKLPDSPSGETPSPDEEPEITNPSSSANISASARLVNSWKTNGKSYYQYDITITNNSGRDCESWSAELKFNKKLELLGSWNANFKINNATVQISSFNYNGYIKDGGNVGNIGMIVCGSENLKLR